MKKLALTLLFITATFATLYAGGTIIYNLTQTKQHEISVGANTQIVDGFKIELIAETEGALIYHNLEENNTEKHYKTFTYQITPLHNQTYHSANVISLTDDIVITNVEQGEYLGVTIKLNQNKVISEGTLVIEFEFEMVEQLSYMGYTADNPLYIYSSPREDVIAAFPFLTLSLYNDTLAIKDNIKSFTNWANFFNAVTTEIAEEYRPYELERIIIFQ